MKKLVLKSPLSLLLGIMFSLLVMAAPAMADITYSLTDLTDTEDNLYQVSFYVSDFDSTAYAGFDIYFDYETYSDVSLLTDDATGNWDETYIFAADETYGYDWVMDAYALTSDESLTGTFTVTSIYTGDRLPGVLDFEYYDADYAVAAMGQTSAVPLPGAALLLFSGLAGLFGLRKKFNA